MQDRLLSWLGTGTAITSRSLKLLSLKQMMQAYKCFPHVHNIESLTIYILTVSNVYTVRIY